MPAVAAGQKAPSFDLTGSDGKLYSLAGTLSKGPVLAVFFKVSCPTCQYTLPFVERLYQQFRDRGAQVWGISQDNARDSQRFAVQYGVTFPVLLDSDPYATSLEYRLTHVPTLFLITPDGQVTMTGDGFCKADLLEIQRFFTQHFHTTPPALFQPNEKIPEFKPG
jgi:peroxiredoxin